MNKDIEPGLSLSLVDKARNAAITLESYYCGKFSHVDVGNPVIPQLITNMEAVQKLLDLEGQILEGGVDSHVQIASVLRKLGDKLTDKGGSTVEINLAALKVEEAIIKNDSRFGVPKPKD